ncbi:protein of unknown function [Shewanella benthica]|uniref:Uncharacterized protein n=1 Tax=Shewanella benthica TaxID=43661 RepID=A0A330M0F8_9GAMM|nr:protein of unknown function [Shewanella benthica]
MTDNFKYKTMFPEYPVNLFTF